MKFNFWKTLGLFFPAPHYKICRWNFFDVQLAEHIDQLTTMVSAMVKDVQHHLKDRLLKRFLFLIVILKYMIQHWFSGRIQPFLPLLVLL